MLVKLMNTHHVQEVHALIHSVDLPKDIFIKSSESEIKGFVGESLIAFHSDSIVGVLMMKSGYIDTIVSSVKGVGVHLVNSLPASKYKVNISKNNKESLNLFGKFGFKHVREEILCGQKRGLYEGKIKG